MGRSEPPLQPVPLVAASIGEALALSTEAGWNQSAADWGLMLEAGRGFGYQAPDGRLVATGVIVPFGHRFGWISMLLVSRDWRRRGLGTRLLGAAVEGLERQRMVPCLDATPEGQKIYRGAGFTALYSMTRWEKAGDPPPEPMPPREDLPATVEALDRAAFGGDRGVILRRLWQRAGGVARVAEGRGFLLARNGRRAVQLGPLCATDAVWAVETLEEALDRIPGAVFVDVPDRQQAVRDLLVRRGFQVQRPFLRMAKGDMKGVGDPARLFVAGGPEIG